MTSRSEDLYALLGISSTASVSQLRKAYAWATQVERSPARLADIRRAYAVLGDPRLRSEYDRGNTVGVGVQRLYVRDGQTGHPAMSAPSSLRGTIPCPSRSGGSPSKWAGGLLLAGLVITGITYAQSYLDWPARDAPPVLVGAALGPEDPTAPVGYRSSTCLTGEGGVTSPSQETSCSQPHRFEVVKVIDLDQVLGRPFTAADRELAADACAAEFRAFTGLADTAGHLYSTGVLEYPSAGTLGPSLNVCMVGSEQPRARSAFGAGR